MNNPEEERRIRKLEAVKRHYYRNQEKMREESRRKYAAKKDDPDFKAKCREKQETSLMRRAMRLVQSLLEISECNSELTV